MYTSLEDLLGHRTCNRFLLVTAVSIPPDTATFSLGGLGAVSYHMPPLEAGQVPALQGRVLISRSQLHMCSLLYLLPSLRRWFVPSGCNRHHSVLIFGRCCGGDAVLHQVLGSGWTPAHLGSGSGSGFQGHLYDWC
jgi:hypothetical protein